MPSDAMAVDAQGDGTTGSPVAEDAEVTGFTAGSTLDFFHSIVDLFHVFYLPFCGAFSRLHPSRNTASQGREAGEAFTLDKVLQLECRREKPHRSAKIVSFVGEAHKTDTKIPFSMTKNL